MQTRRNFIQIGFSSLLGIGLAEIIGNDGTLPQKAKNVIQIFLPGGFAAQETFDPKPLAAVQFRGPFGVINAKNGDILSENLQLTAKIADKITIIRSVTHNESAHERGVSHVLTGWKPSPAIVYPSLGSIICKVCGDKNEMPGFVAIPNKYTPELGSGFLESKYEPFGVGSDPISKNYKVRDLTSSLLSNRRKSLLQIVDEQFKKDAQFSDAIAAMDQFYQKSFDIVTSNKVQNAFDVEKEPEYIQEAYGKTTAGKRMLLARRLIEAGSRFVTLNYGSWDMHTNIRNGISQQVPELDRAFSALILDLESKGLLAETIVVINSEFGRTPLNNQAGRDHWPKVFSSVLAGGGIKPGIYGASDATCREPVENPVNPADITATILNQLGISPQKEMMTSDKRPVILSPGEIIKDLV